MTRKAGVLMPVSSLPARHGVGDMGPEAYRYVDLLQDAGARYWQILPMNPLGFGNSPYQPYSSYAGDPLFINLDRLAEEGLLPSRPEAFQANADAVDYPAVRTYKEGVLREAFARFTPDANYEAFVAQAWVYPYAVFMAFKRVNGMRCWNEWPAAMKAWPYARGVDLAPFAKDIAFEMFAQYMFFTQWMALKGYANAHGIEIIGDIPFYVGLDSLDVWTSRENFLLDAEGAPTLVAGVPPDYFSETGQRWGNPIYDWDHMERDGFAFWIDRLRYSAQLFDVIRIDHFRAFDTYWEIPAASPTAVEGAWKEAPGYAVFDAVFAALPDLTIVAEDLGMLRKEVYVLRDFFHFRGMKILQFTFEPAQVAPRAGDAHMVVYTGTHDNQTTLDWYRAQPFGWRMRARRALAKAGYRGPIARRFVRLALDDAADIAVLPAADIMGLTDRARINTPGTVGSPNWEWKLRDLNGFAAAMDWFARSIRESGRG